MRFPPRGRHDNAPTPSTLYNAIIAAGYADACDGAIDFLHDDDIPPRAYCNPPFSKKSEFVIAACRHARRGRKILMYIPADTTTQWFRYALQCGATPVFLTKRTGRGGRYPAMLLLFNIDINEINFVNIVAAAYVADPP